MIIVLLYGTGLRISEALNLKVSDIVLSKVNNKGTIIVLWNEGNGIPHRLREKALSLIEK